MNLKERHELLYSKIPSFGCKPGCTDCCGPIMFSKWEWDQVNDKRQVTLKDIKTLTCPYAVKGKCEIYGQRPLICRLFGAVDTPHLTCPHGCRPLWQITEEQGQEIMNDYLKMEDE